MACDNTINRPIDSFIKYFVGDAKPYHTKILEIVERYVFRETISVSIKETPKFSIGMHNKPGCSAVGFGVDYDSECGFDTLSCCDLFQCMGGYGLIFDNSALLESYEIVSIDGVDGEVVVKGYHISDTFLNIKSFPSLDTIVVSGDQSRYFDSHELMWVVKKRRAEVVAKTANTITLAGNYADLLKQKKKLETINSASDDGEHTVISAVFDGTNTIVVVGNKFTLTNMFGYVLIETNSKNNGVYQIDSYTIQNGDTHLKLYNETPLRFTDSNLEGGYGSVQLRTGLIQNRRIIIEGNSEANNNSDWKIVNTQYDIDNNNTILIVDGTLITSSGGTANLYGYETAAGYDAPEECSKPTPFTVNASMSEFLKIKIIDPAPSPTPTASTTATATPTPTPSTTMTITPTPSNTPPPTPTPTPTPSMAAEIDFDGNDIIDWQDPDTLSGGLISDNPTVIFDGGAINK